MTKKIGRNEPCPCGSGKKYKHCCMLNENLDAGLTQPLHSTLPMASLDAPKIKAYFENHDSSEIFDYLIALQLNPENHGKNMRIERMAQLAISTIDSGEKPIDAKVLKKLMDEEYADDVMEDIPMNMFCENVLFFGGNYPFFPGLSTHVMELYNVMSGTIYRNEDKFSKEFRKEIYLGVTFLLEFGKVIALRSGLSGMTRGNEKSSEGNMLKVKMLNHPERGHQGRAEAHQHQYHLLRPQRRGGEARDQQRFGRHRTL